MALSIEQWSEMSVINDTSLILNETLLDIDLENGSTSGTTVWYPSTFGVLLIVPEWEAALTALVLSLIIMVTLVGNVLVILSVFTYKPLRSAPNFFIVSLAVADMTVALLVLPLNVAYSILGRWVLGKIICEFWLTSDVLCCTASILHLCAIAVDRYRAITDPVNYARKRTLQRVLLTIAIVWIMSFLISSPPILGWNDWPAEFKEDTACSLTAEQGYVIYSALGSFYIPLVVMTAVYIRIFIATRRRLRQRAKASRLSAMARQRSVDSRGNKGDKCRSSISSIENNGHDNQMEHLRTTECGSRNASFRSTNGPLAPQPPMERREPRNEPEGGGSNVATTAMTHTPVLGQEQGGETVGANGSRNSFNSSLKGRIQTQLAANDCDNTKLNPANVSDESITDVTEAVPLSSNKNNRPANHQRESHSRSGNRGNKKQNRASSSQMSQFVEEKQRISLSKEIKAARTLGIIMGVFVVCWLPFFLMYVILPFCKNCDKPSQKIVNFITWLGYVNSSLNPIIYTIFNLDFRKAFKKLLHIGK